MKVSWSLVWIGILIVISGNVSASSWWVLCDHCSTDSSFEFAAMSAPGTYSPVYVSNRESNETRKYDRITVVDDIDDGLEQLTSVTLAYLSFGEKQAFEQAIENAQTVYQRFDRNDLAGLVPGLSDQSSLVGDISNGYIDTALSNALRFLLELEGLLPTRTSVNASAGISIQGNSGNVGAGETIRVRDLVIIIDYEDGSSLTLTRRGSDGQFVDWTLTDADGNRIPIDNPSQGGTSIAPSLFPNDFEFVFGASSQQDALIFMDFIHRTSTAECSASTTTGPDGTDRMIVRCSRG